MYTDRRKSRQAGILILMLSASTIKSLAVLCGIAALAIGVYVSLAGAPFRWYNILGDQNSGRFDRAALQAVVDQIRHFGLKQGESKEFWRDSLSSPSLRPLALSERPARGQGAGHVWAEMS